MVNKRDWIKRNRNAIDKWTNSPYKNDTERELWVDNDETLYGYYRKGWDLE
jgi:hypothetical protein